MAAAMQHDSQMISGDAANWQAVLPYLPGLLVETLRRCPHRAAPWIDPIEGTLVLADISGFTPMSERLAQAGKEGAELLTGIINQYFGRMLDIARAHGCINIRFGGDALLLAFKDDRHAVRAVAAAASMQRASLRFTTFRAGQQRFRLRMTVGVHSGTFWSAAAGLPDARMQHLILGPETSVLAEVQGTAKAGELLITTATLDHVGDLCLIEPHGDAYRVQRLIRRVPRAATQDNTAAPPILSGEVLAYLPPPIAAALRSHGQAKPMEAEHRKITILFINVLGINELLEENGPAVLLDQLQKYLSSLVQLADQYGGFLVDNDVYTHGLKLILIFGAPVAHEQDSANAQRLALELGREMEQQGLALRHRIGIHSGFAFAGDVGTSYRRVYTVMGDAVNLSARLMSAGTPGQVLVSSQAIAEAGPGFAVEELAPIRVKGKKDPIPICLLEGEESTRRPSLAEPSGSFVGREAELERFRHVCHEVQQGKCRSIVLSGETGIGKSRLVMEFRRLMSGHWSIHQGICHSHRIGKPFDVWIQVLDSLFDVSASDDSRARSEKAMSALEALDPKLLPMASLLNPLLGLTIPESDVVLSLEEESRRHRLFELITGLLQGKAATSPLALVFEDLHDADGSSIQLINHVSAAARSSRLLFCLSLDPRKATLLNPPPPSTVAMPLGELPPSAALRLVREMLDCRDIPREIEDAVLSKARGNPLFLQEVSASIRQSGALDRICGASSFKMSREMASLNIPDRIHTLVMSRIDNLDQTAREVLRTASVVGTTFDCAVLERLLGQESGQYVRGKLAYLAELDLTIPEGDAQQDTYRFRHDLIQEVAYDSLTFARRREMHHRVGSYLEETEADHLESQYEILVHHYGRSGDRHKTRLYATKAAEKARKVFAHEEAIAHYRRGLECTEEKDLVGECLQSYFVECIGDCHELAGQHEEATRALRQSLRQWRSVIRHSPTVPSLPPELGASLRPEIRESVLCHKLSVSYERNSDYDSSLKWLEPAEAALPPGQLLQEARINITRSVALYRKGLYEEAIRCGLDGLDLSKRSNDPGQLAYAHNMLANCYLESGSLSQAIGHYRQAVRLFDRLDDLARQAAAHNNLGACYHLLGDLEKALHHYQIAIKADERMGNLTAVAIAHNNIGEVLLAQGLTEDSIGHLQTVVETYEERGDPLAAAGLALVNLCRAYQGLGQYDQARTHLKRGRALLRKANAGGLLMEAQIQQAELELEQGQIDRAIRTCSQVLHQTRQTGARLLEARALRVMGRVNLARGQSSEAETQLLESAILAEGLKADHERALSLLCLAELYGADVGCPDSLLRCRPFLNKAITIFRRMGSQGDLSRALRFQSSLRLRPG
jgi:class 3 adenylate cyclase/tetratricopeptide (TPR) repeat protein